MLRKTNKFMLSKKLLRQAFLKRKEVMILKLYVIIIKKIHPYLSGKEEILIFYDLTP